MNSNKSLLFLLPLTFLLTGMYSDNSVNVTVKNGVNEINYGARYNLVSRDGTISIEAKTGTTTLYIAGTNITYYTEIKGSTKLKNEGTFFLSNKNSKTGPCSIHVKELPSFKNKIIQFDIVINKILKNTKETKNEIPFTKRTYSFKYK